MRIFTAYTRPKSPPVLIREGFSWGAFIFGPLWLLANQAWLATILSVCAYALIALSPLHGFNPLCSFALSFLIGLFGRDIRRWSLERGGYVLAHVVAAPDADVALARLLERRPDLIDEVMA